MSQILASTVTISTTALAAPLTYQVHAIRHDGMKGAPGELLRAEAAVTPAR